MSGHDQTNVRVPTKSRALVHLVARMLREDTRFHAKLQQFVNGQQVGEAFFALAERVERLESVIASKPASLQQRRMTGHREHQAQVMHREGKSLKEIALHTGVPLLRLESYFGKGKDAA